MTPSVPTALCGNPCTTAEGGGSTAPHTTYTRENLPAQPCTRGGLCVEARASGPCGGTATFDDTATSGALDTAGRRAYRTQARQLRRVAVHMISRGWGGSAVHTEHLRRLHPARVLPVEARLFAAEQQPSPHGAGENARVGLASPRRLGLIHRCNATHFTTTLM